MVQILVNACEVDRERLREIHHPQSRCQTEAGDVDDSHDGERYRYVHDGPFHVSIVHHKGSPEVRYNVTADVTDREDNLKRVPMDQLSL